MGKKDKEFLKDLGALLEKYDVNISFDCDDASDLNSMYDERLVISNNKTNKEIFRVNDYIMFSSDIKKKLE